MYQEKYVVPDYRGKNTNCFPPCGCHVPTIGWSNHANGVITFSGSPINSWFDMFPGWTIPRSGHGGSFDQLKWWLRLVFGLCLYTDLYFWNSAGGHWGGVRKETRSFGSCFANKKWRTTGYST